MPVVGSQLADSFSVASVCSVAEYSCWLSVGKGSGIGGQSAAGRSFKISVEIHLGGCSMCRRTVERLKAQLTEPWVLQLDDLARRADDQVRAVLRDLVVGLKSIASARGAFLAAHAMPGFRSQPARTVPAVVLDAEGKMIIGQEGRPQTMEFCLIRAQLDRDGTAIIELSTVDERIRGTADSEFLLSVTINCEQPAISTSSSPHPSTAPDGREPLSCPCDEAARCVPVAPYGAGRSRAPSCRWSGLSHR